MARINGATVIALADLIELRNRAGKMGEMETKSRALQQRVTYLEDENLRMRRAYEPDPASVEFKPTPAQMQESETVQRQRSAAALASGEDGEAEFLETARQAAWRAIEGDVKTIERIMAGEKDFPDGWPPELPRDVMANRFTGLTDDGRQIAKWPDGFIDVTVAGAPTTARPVPLPEKQAAPVTYLSELATKRGVKFDY